MTNGRADAQNAKLEEMGLQHAVDIVVTSGGVGFKKPDPRIYEAALAELGVKASETLYVGDNPEADIAGPAKAGMRTAWLQNGRDWPLSEVRPDYSINYFSDLEPVVATLRRQSLISATGVVTSGVVHHATKA